jgi:hypothetical protein
MNRKHLCSGRLFPVEDPYLIAAPELNTFCLLEAEDRLRVFENRLLERIFGPQGDEVTGSCRKLHNEELNNLYSSLNIVSMIKSKIHGDGHT